MKRHNNLYERIYSMENLRLADALAQQGQKKQNSPAVIKHNKNAEANLLKLHYDLVNKTLKPPRYTLIKVQDPKERDVFSSPFYPNLILDYAILNVIGPILVSTFTADTYACIKGRGVHKAGDTLKKALRNEEETKYYLQVDIKKFYPTVDHGILKMLLRRKFKDNDLLWLLDMIIDSLPGLPIGRYLSQIISNFYLTGLDHLVKEKLRLKYYFRYVDDLLFLAPDKKSLHELRKQLSAYLHDNLKLEMKSNWRVAPTICGIDIFGYKYYPRHSRMRKRNKQSLARAVAKGKPRSSIAGHLGWAKHCNSRHLIKKLLPNEKLQSVRN